MRAIESHYLSPEFRPKIPAAGPAVAGGKNTTAPTGPAVPMSPEDNQQRHRQRVSPFGERASGLCQVFQSDENEDRCTN